MIDYTIETYETIHIDIEPILEKHYTEVEWAQEFIPLNPDFDKYQDLDERGDIIFLGMREEGVLVGYATFMLYDHPHHKGTTFASSDLLYIDPKYRGAEVMKFFDWCEANLKEEGADVINVSFKILHDHPNLMFHLGFESTEVVYSKFIG